MNTSASSDPLRRAPRAPARAARRAVPSVLPVLAALALLAVPALLPACRTVAGTGRSQFNVMPLGTEIGFGEQAWEETLASAKLVKSGAQYEMVQRLGARIAESARRRYAEPADEFDWEIVLVDDPKMVNAWCLPGGKMAVYTGLLPVTQDEESLAVVVGHEVAHAVARHGGERMSQDLALQATLTVAAAGSTKMDPEDRDQLMQVLVGAGTLGFMLPFSRKHESEADELGLYMSADAGYDPRAALGLWDRMAAASKGEAPPEFLSTHPSEATRKERLKALMPQALEIWEASRNRGG